MSTAADAAQPFPPRWRWAKRGSIAAACIAAVLIGVRIYWGVYADRVLAERRAAAHARGEPFDAIDLQPPDAPSSQNAADAYIAAAAAITATGVDSPASSAFEFPDGPPFNNRWWRMAKAAHDAHVPAHLIAHNAAAMTGVDWHLNYSTPFASGSFGSLNAMRNLANSLADAAMYDHLIGDDVAALSKIRDLLALSARLDRHNTLIGRLVSVGIQALALDRLMMIAPGLATADADRATTQPVRPASRAEIQRLIVDLLDSSSQTEAARRALLGERTLAFVSVQAVVTNNPLLRPAHLLAKNEELDDALGKLAVSPPPAAEANAVVPPGPATQSAQSPLQRSIAPTFRRYLVTEYRVMQERLFAATSLATQLYRLDHAGRWPATTGDLVPKYLPEPPLDLLSPTSSPLQLRLFNGRPVVWSVGENGIDDTHTAVDLPTGPAYGFYAVYLSPRKAPAGNQTVSFVDDQARDLSRILPAGATTRPIDLSPMSPYAEHEKAHEDLSERH